MKTIQWMLATYVPMPAALQRALADGTVRTVHNEHGATAYFIARSVADKERIRRAIAQRKLWELVAVCGVGLAIGTAAAGVAHYFSM